MRIALLTHACDPELRPGFFWKPERIYMIQGILEVMRQRGHTCRICRGLDRRLPKADVAIAHVDCSITPAEYADALSAYPLVINGKVTDITKRRISRHLLSPDSEWPGPVLVKSNLNCGGFPEETQNRNAARQGRPLPHPGNRPVREYRIYDRLPLVPDTVWDDPALVVEKFLPEQEEDGYALRNWVFFGEKERCTRHTARHPLVKGEGVIRSEPCPVPRSLRDARTRLGIDYGKIDFVMHGGEAVLLDVNRTPGSAERLSAFLEQGAAHLADGLEAMMTARSTA